jgi:hypothetical protein
VTGTHTLKTLQSFLLLNMGFMKPFLHLSAGPPDHQSVILHLFSLTMRSLKYFSRTLSTNNKVPSHSLVSHSCIHPTTASLQTHSYIRGIRTDPRIAGSEVLTATVLSPGIQHSVIRCIGNH